ncbi:MAG: DUF952 domain-containing protein [Pseudomonadota bacterium]
MTGNDRLPKLIFKIEHAQAWREAKRAGVYAGAPIDRRDGFIHFSAATQVSGTLERYFADRSDLLLIAVDTSRCGDALLWEVSRGGERFPHLYATLSMEAVVGVEPIGADGTLPNAKAWGLTA